MKFLLNFYFLYYICAVTKKGNLIESIEIKAGMIALRSDGIMLMNISEDYIVDIQDLKDIVAAVGKIGKGKKFPNLIIAERIQISLQKPGIIPLQMRITFIQKQMLL